QEQVNNILKHAEAKTIDIAVTYDNNSIEIRVEDDGKGFNTKRKRKGIGISNMINRVELYDGKFDITSSPGNGCILDVLIPVKTL
ncbi:sensor histidine kinase, partial [Salmonella sp. SAL4438]|uniref:sensor histidine kinase n=1 Tax=Salmonella sp. SAL4438 TaxID=3159893 RepID=UPI00397ACFDF